MTLSQSMRRMFNERIDVQTRTQTAFDEYGNPEDIFVSATNPDSTDGLWAGGFDLDTRGFEDNTAELDVGSTRWIVFVEPDAPIDRTTRIVRPDGTIVSLLSGGKVTDALGGAHYEFEGITVS